MKPVQLLLIAMVTNGVSAWGGKPAPPPEAGQLTPAVKVRPAPAPTAKPAPVKAPSAKLMDPAASLDGLTYVKGGPVSLEDGKVFVVEFWATWCAPCRASIPHLTKIQKRFKEKGVTVIGISSEKELEKVKDFVAGQGGKMDYTVAFDAERAVTAGYMDAYGQRGIPTALIVNGKGAVVWVGHPMGEVDKVLEQVLAGTFDAEAHAIIQAKREAASRKLGMVSSANRSTGESAMICQRASWNSLSSLFEIE